MKPRLDADETLDAVLRRSDGLEASIIGILESQGRQYLPYDDSKRTIASVVACELAFEHAHALRTLIATGHPTSAISMLRLQYEALTRAVWLLYAAPDHLVDKLQSELSLETERAANKMPLFSEMLASLEGKAPDAAYVGLVQFKTTMWTALNSFVHIGIHPLQRSQTGYPEPLLEDVVRSSNGLLTMTAMMLALLSGDEQVAKTMSAVQPGFADCLPTLLRP